MTWYEDRKTLFYKEQGVIEAKYPNLHFNIKNNQMYLSGELCFRAVFNDELIEDSYEIEILFPDDYPDDFPVVREISNKIEEDYHHFPNGTLCLGTPIEVSKRFFEAPNALNFIESLLIPYLYRYSYIKKFDKAPFSESPHGLRGIVTWYQDYFEMKDYLKILRLLLVALDDKYRDNIRCPCGSRQKLRKCHGPKLMGLSKVPKKYLRLEANYVFKALQDAHISPK